MNTPHQNEEFLRSIYKAYQKKDAQAVENLVHSLPEISDELIASITPQAWERIALSERPPEPVIVPDDREKPRKVSWKVIVPVVLVCLAALVVFGYLALKYLVPPEVTPTPEIMVATVTSMATLTPLPSVVTEEIEEPDPTPTDTPVPTIAPTPVPASAYLTDPAAILPRLPSQYDQAWVLNDDNAMTKDKEELWVSKTYESSAGILESYMYKGNGGTLLSGFTITYRMDQALPVDGRYEILVMDTPNHSQNLDVTYRVSINDVPIQPVYGTGRVLFNNSTDQTVPVWLSLGFYDLKAGEGTLVILAEVPDLPINSFYAADRIVIGHLPDAQAALLNGLDNNNNHPLAMLLDDAAADLKIYGGETFVSSAEGWESAPSVATWGGAFMVRKAGWANTIRVVWGPRGLLPAGKYQLWVRIPDALASATPVEYFLLINGSAGERIPPRTLNQADAAGTWVSVAEYNLDKPASVQVVMEAPKDISGDIGIDAVALITIPE